MAQPPNPNPTLHAKIGSSTTEVSLRDWLNTRLAPFLKRAITESLESEAQYPLQWLGEHLIQQSILFEGNPDSTNIKERFLYTHDTAAKPAQSHGPEQSRATPTPSSSLLTAQPVSEQPQPAMSPMTVGEQEGHPSAQEENPSPLVVSSNTVEPQSTSTTENHNLSINGTMQVEQTESQQHAPTEQTEQTLPTQDAEMTNAP